MDGIVHFIFQGVSSWYFQIMMYFCLSETNGVDPDEMPHYVAIHLGLQISQSSRLWAGFPVYKGLNCFLEKTM